MRKSMRRHNLSYLFCVRLSCFILKEMAGVGSRAKAHASPVTLGRVDSQKESELTRQFTTKWLHTQKPLPSTMHVYEVSNDSGVSNQCLACM